jgi:hypothetical protein
MWIEAYFLLARYTLHSTLCFFCFVPKHKTELHKLSFLTNYKFENFKTLNEITRLKYIYRTIIRAIGI